MKEKVVILGAGESGKGAAILAKKQGYEVFVSDYSPIPNAIKKLLEELEINWEEGQHSGTAMTGAKWVVKSPGIPEKAAIIQSLRAEGHTILSEIEFASRFTDAVIIGITGSNGKTTTTLMTYEILKNAGFNVGLAGNIGQSFAQQVAEENYDYYVLEISSFQLDDIQKFAPHVAVITNITPDHLDRYNYDFNAYLKAKLNITKNQKSKDWILFNEDDPILTNFLLDQKPKAKLLPFGLLPKAEGTSFQNDKIFINKNEQMNTIDTLGFPFSGKHNMLNAMAAATIGNLLNISDASIRDCLSHFKGAPHRMENVLTIQKVKYINDSKATNVNATFFALDSIETPIVWIVGGVDKGNDYESLLPLVNRKVKAIICLGVDNEKLKASFGNVCEIWVETQSMQEAVKVAHKVASEKETVLLSPACASFDLFNNYEDRGEQFKNAVRNL